MARQVTFDHPLWHEAGEPLTEQSLQNLMVLVRLGDQDSFDLVVKSYLRLALSVVGKYLARLKSKRWVDDLVSAAVEGVVLGVRDAQYDPTVKDISGRVVSRVHYQIGDFLNSNWQQKFEGSILLDHDRILLEARDDDNLSRIENIIEENVENELEEKIVALRREGYKDDEIAEQLCLSRSTVQVIRQDLHDRVKDLLPGRKCHDETENT